MKKNTKIEKYEMVTLVYKKQKIQANIELLTSEAHKSLTRLIQICVGAVFKQVLCRTFLLSFFHHQSLTL